MKMKLIAMLLSLTLTFGIIAPGALALAQVEEGDEAQYAALYQSIYGDYGDMPTIFGVDDLMGDLLAWLLKTAATSAVSKGSGKIFDSIFPDDARHREVIEHLHVIEGQLKDISDQLSELKRYVGEQFLILKLENKMELMAAADTVIGPAFKKYEGKDASRETMDDALDMFFRYHPKGYDNAFFFFKYYCTLVGGTGTYSQESTFALYDKIAENKWNFDLEGAGFRQVQRDMDIHFITRMASLLLLWLEKEERYGYQSPYEKDLPMYRKMLTQGLQDVYDNYERRLVRLDSESRAFHYKGSNYTASFDVYVGYAPGEMVTASFKQPVFEKTLRKDNNIREVEEACRTYIESLRPASGDATGEFYHLITADELKQLHSAAGARGLTVQQLLQQAAGFPEMAGIEYVLFSDTENQPLHFAGETNTLGRRRNLYLQNAHYTQKGKDMWSNTHVGNASMCVSDRHRLDDVWPSSYIRYKVIYEGSSPYMTFFDDTTFLPIWVRNSQNVPGTEAPAETADPDAPQADVHIDAIDGDAVSFTVLYPDDAGEITDAQPEEPEKGTMRLVADVEIADRQALVGQSVHIYFTDEGEITRLTLSGEADGQSVEGTVVRVEFAAQIIGGDADLVVAVDGDEHIFILAEGLSLAEDVTPGAQVRVTYHAEKDALVADAVTLLDMPGPLRQTIEGMVAHVHCGDDMPGGAGLLVLDVPGGMMSFLIPAATPIGEDILDGATVQVDYHSDESGDVADAVTLLDMPGPVPTPVDGDAPMPGPIDEPAPPTPVPQWAEGQVTAIADGMDMPGAERTITVMADREFILSLPPTMDITSLQVGDTVHADFHEEAGRNILDEYHVLMPGPLYDPAEDDPVVMDEDAPSGVF